MCSFLAWCLESKEKFVGDLVFWRFKHSLILVSSSASSSSGGAEGVQSGNQVARPSSLRIDVEAGGGSRAGAMWCLCCARAVRWRSGSSSVLMSDDDDE